ncbi:CBS domain-containing protein [Trinickia caryophylli]|uniref:CBS domain-containing protein n=1 Tax=Trinickia caryophylli TaxID=28094 RepID=A0A1X7EBG3_TRICW|nr:CBS domain-containing protein [Trinickia caryophylli]PMS12940.1 CBS domain-containing protein [Trinickia caryophylli]TRX14701.1 CBS domain-containing protein [Trinickia caryophylli]WQE14544.1 CBS domain-containing protein [Trinickia caryophylli]SMF31103.1 CBS domain-containing protein [Trinickia caryophylli]GLU32048.1 CBS domain-containing protein [Trinickia caryophylli]
MTRVADVMTRDAVTLAPNETVRAAARMMDELNVGALPVCDGKRLVGMVTDRDIAVRAVSAGMDLESPVERIASEPVAWCFEDDDVNAVHDKMADRQIRRLPVVDNEKHLVGVVSLGDLATHEDGNMSSTLGAISSPSGPDRAH